MTVPGVPSEYTLLSTNTPVKGLVVAGGNKTPKLYPTLFKRRLKQPFSIAGGRAMCFSYFHRNPSNPRPTSGSPKSFHICTKTANTPRRDFQRLDAMGPQALPTRDQNAWKNYLTTGTKLITRTHKKT